MFGLPHSALGSTSAPDFEIVGDTTTVDAHILPWARASPIPIEPIRLPPRSPNLNAYAERFVRSVKTECTKRMVFFSSSSLERALTQYVAHYHEERNHQGLQNRLLKRTDRPIRRGGRVQRRERLGGMFSFYHREAA